MQRLARWLLAPAVAAAGACWSVRLVLPRLLYPPLSSAELQEVPARKAHRAAAGPGASCGTMPERRCCRASAGLLLVVGAIATWRQVRSAGRGRSPSGSPARSTNWAARSSMSGSAASTPWNGSPRTPPQTEERSPRSSVPLFAATPPGWFAPPDGPEHPSPTVDGRLPWLRHAPPTSRGPCGCSADDPPAPETNRSCTCRESTCAAAFLHRARLSDATLRPHQLRRCRRWWEWTLSAATWRTQICATRTCSRRGSLGRN